METLKSCPFEEPVGKYEIENDKPMMTHEEWIKSANTEQLADFICRIQTDGALQVDCMTYKERMRWLKQPHTNE